MCKVQTSPESLRPNYQLKEVIASYQHTKGGPNASKT